MIVVAFILVVLDFSGDEPTMSRQRYETYGECVRAEYRIEATVPEAFAKCIEIKEKAI